jgi:L-lactate dehydrogenase complex protein LldF
MLTDECEMRPFLEKRGIVVMETDLGERIQQLDDEPPSHIVVPAVHKLKTDVARVFADTIGTDRKNSDVHYLAESQRQHTRPYFLRADAGMTGANFAVAETGTVVVCTNEGNAGTLSVNPAEALHRVRRDREVIPKIEHLGVFVRMLSRSALGLADHPAHVALPQAAQGHRDAHRARSTTGRSLRSACRLLVLAQVHPLRRVHEHMPVYRRSGGLSYGATYSDPSASSSIRPTTCASTARCRSPRRSTAAARASCPVRINIHEQIYKWRQIIAERRQLPFVKQEAMRAAGKVLSSPKLYRAAVETAGAGLEHLPRLMMYSRLNAWGRQREVPAAPPYTFRQWYLKNRGGKK